MEKLNLKSIIWSSIFPAVIATFLSFLLQFLILPSGKVTVGNSVFDGINYLTTVSIRNHQSQRALRNIEIFISPSVSVNSVISSADYAFINQARGIIVNSVAPNTTATLLFLSEYEVCSDSINVGSDTRVTVVHLEHERSITQLFIINLIVYFFLFLIMGVITNALNDKRLNEYKQKRDEAITELKNCTASNEESISIQKRKIRELQVYSLIRIQDYGDELRFWKDTIRKTFYQSSKTSMTS